MKITATNMKTVFNYRMKSGNKRRVAFSVVLMNVSLGIRYTEYGEKCANRWNKSHSDEIQDTKYCSQTHIHQIIRCKLRQTWDIAISVTFHSPILWYVFVLFLLSTDIIAIRIKFPTFCVVFARKKQISERFIPKW